MTSKNKILLLTLSFLSSVSVCAYATEDADEVAAASRKPGRGKKKKVKDRAKDDDMAFLDAEIAKNTLPVSAGGGTAAATAVVACRLLSQKSLLQIIEKMDDARVDLDGRSYWLALLKSKREDECRETFLDLMNSPFVQGGLEAGCRPDYVNILSLLHLGSQTSEAGVNKNKLKAICKYLQRLDVRLIPHGQRHLYISLLGEACETGASLEQLVLAFNLTNDPEICDYLRGWTDEVIKKDPASLDDYTRCMVDVLGIETLEPERKKTFIWKFRDSSVKNKHDLLRRIRSFVSDEDFHTSAWSYFDRMAPMSMEDRDRYCDVAMNLVPEPLRHEYYRRTLCYRIFNTFDLVGLQNFQQFVNDVHAVSAPPVIEIWRVKEGYALFLHNLLEVGDRESFLTELHFLTMEEENFDGKINISVNLARLSEERRSLYKGATERLDKFSKSSLGDVFLKIPHTQHDEYIGGLLRCVERMMADPRAIYQFGLETLHFDEAKSSSFQEQWANYSSVMPGEANQKGLFFILQSIYYLCPPGCPVENVETATSRVMDIYFRKKGGFYAMGRASASAAGAPSADAPSTPKSPLDGLASDPDLQAYIEENFLTDDELEMVTKTYRGEGTFLEKLTEAVESGYIEFLRRVNKKVDRELHTDAVVDASPDFLTLDMLLDTDCLDPHSTDGYRVVIPGPAKTDYALLREGVYKNLSMGLLRFCENVRTDGLTRHVYNEFKIKNLKGAVGVKKFRLNDGLRVLFKVDETAKTILLEPGIKHYKKRKKGRK